MGRKLLNPGALSSSCRSVGPLFPGLDGRPEREEVQDTARPSASPGCAVELCEAETKRIPHMKRIALVAGMVLTLCVGTLSAEARGCWRGGCFWPFWSFGLGWGLGAAYSYPAYRYSYPYTAYGYYYPPPVYTYNPQVSYAQTAPPAPSAQPAPKEPELQVWVPSTPGPGKWVPDP